MARNDESDGCPVGYCNCGCPDKVNPCSPCDGTPDHSPTAGLARTANTECYGGSLYLVASPIPGTNLIVGQRYCWQPSERLNDYVGQGKVTIVK